MADMDEGEPVTDPPASLGAETAALLFADLLEVLINFDFLNHAVLFRNIDPALRTKKTKLRAIYHR